MFRCHVVTSLMHGGVVKMCMHIYPHTYVAWVQCVWQVTAASYSASHLLSICLWYLPHTVTHTHKHTHRGRPWIQASLTLNLAQADSNFCLQITFQWLHKSAASYASFSSPPRLPASASLSSPLLRRSLPLSLLLQPHFILSCINLHPPSISASISPSLFLLRLSTPITCFLVSPHSFSLALAQ